MAKRRVYRRDRFGRFAAKTGVYAINRDRTTGAKARKKLGSSSSQGTRSESAFTRWAVGEGDRTRRTGAPWLGTGVRATRRNFVGPGKRRKGQTLRKVSRVHRRTRTAGPNPFVSGALLKSGLGTGRRRRATTIGKVPTPRVRRGRARRLPTPRRRRRPT